MKTRTFLAVASGMLMLGGAALAQGRPANPAVTPPANPPSNRPNARSGVQQRFLQRHPMLRLLARLNLTAAQKTQIRGLFETAQARARAIRQDASLTPEQKRAQLRPVLKSLHENVLAVLTPAQKRHLAQMRRAAIRQYANSTARNRLAGALQTLNLTPAQKAEIRRISQEQREKGRALRESRLAGADRRDRIQALAQETRQRIFHVLTPEQQARLRANRAARRPGPNA